MLDGNKIKVRVGGDFEPIPMDKYTVQVADVNIASSFNKFKGVEEDKLNYQFVILDDKPMKTVGQDGKPTSTRGRFLWHRVTPILSSRSWLMKLAKAVYGRDLTKEEINNFDPESIMGKQVDVMVEQNPAKDDPLTIYNNIVSYAKTEKPLAVIADPLQKQVTVEKSSVPVTAPESPTEGEAKADEFIKQLEAEEKDYVAGLEKMLVAAKEKAEKAKKAAQK